MNNSAREAAANLIRTIEGIGMVEWDGTYAIKMNTQQAIDALGGVGCLVNQMTPGAAALYLQALVIVNS